MNLIREYVKKFNENFPVFAPMPEGKTVEEVLKECLRTGKPYIPKYKKTSDY